jgi:hypothetical protein
MNNEDTPRSTPPYQPGRRPYPSKYQENRYSAGENRFNAAGENRFASGATQSRGSYGYNKPSAPGYAAGGQHQNKKPDRFHREPVNYSEKLTRQNDVIIKLLKEIRDRLPAPPVVAGAEPEVESAIQNALPEAAVSADLPQEPASAPVNESAIDQDADEDSPGNTL